MAQEEHVFIVFTEPTAGREDEYNDWYNNVHLAEVTAVAGFKAARRYVLSPDQPADGVEEVHKYLAIYWIEGDIAEAFRGLTAAVEAGDMAVSEAMNAATAKGWRYTALGPTMHSAD